MLKPVLVSASEEKVAEVARILGRSLDHRALDLQEVQGVELQQVIEAKAREAYNVLGGGAVVIVEDTGLFIRAWGGLPGALVRWFLERVGPEGICKMLEPFADRRAWARTAVGVFDGDLRVFHGEVSGVIVSAPRGRRGFGFDSIFVPNGEALTLAEMTSTEKDRYSMRRAAFDKMWEELGSSIEADPGVHE